MSIFRNLSGTPWIQREPGAAGPRRVPDLGEGRDGPVPLLRNSPAQRSLTRSDSPKFLAVWRAEPALCGLLRNSRKTQCGAKQFLIRLEVRAAPFALLRRRLAAALAAGFVLLVSVQAGDLNPKALAYKKPDQIKWTESSPNGPIQAVLVGDPSKPGLYVILVKWLPHRMSHPHFHPNDRFATVISGTWWVGTGPKFDPDGTTPLPPGSFVTHFAKQIHYDGAKDQEVVLQIVGQGPDTATDAEEKAAEQK